VKGLDRLEHHTIFVIEAQRVFWNCIGLLKFINQGFLEALAVVFDFILRNFQPQPLCSPNKF